jgi:hypothetical protein
VARPSYRQRLARLKIALKHGPKLKRKNSRSTCCALRGGAMPKLNNFPSPKSFGIGGQRGYGGRFLSALYGRTAGSLFTHARYTSLKKHGARRAERTRNR